MFSDDTSARGRPSANNRVIPPSQPRRLMPSRQPAAWSARSSKVGPYSSQMRRSKLAQRFAAGATNSTQNRNDAGSAAVHAATAPDSYSIRPGSLRKIAHWVSGWQLNHLVKRLNRHPRWVPPLGKFTRSRSAVFTRSERHRTGGRRLARPASDVQRIKSRGNRHSHDKANKKDTHGPPLFWSRNGRGICVDRQFSRAYCTFRTVMVRCVSRAIDWV